MSRVLLICVILASSSTLAKEPLIVAHRGLLLHAPENTLANFRACAELRIGFEFDVERTHDGGLVCIHDSTVDRTTNGTGRVSTYSLEKLQQLDAGSWFDSKFASEKVPSIEQILQLIAQHKQHEMLFAVDLKAPDVEQEVVRLAQQYQVLHRLIFIGRTISEQSIRDRIKAQSSAAQIAIVVNSPDEFRTAVASNADWIYFRYLPPAEHTSAAHRASKRTFIAGPSVSGNVSENWRRAQAAEIDAILTDYPLELRMTLRNTSRQ